MMPGGLLTWSVDICLDHMFFVLIGDGQGVLGWLMVGGANLQSLNPKSSIVVYGPLKSDLEKDFITSIIILWKWQDKSEIDWIAKII